MPVPVVGPPNVHTKESKNMRVEVEEEEESIDQREGGEEAKSSKVVSPTSEGETEENYYEAAVSRSAEHEVVKKPKFSFFGSILKFILRILVVAAFSPYMVCIIHLPLMNGRFKVRRMLGDMFLTYL